MDLFSLGTWASVSDPSLCNSLLKTTDTMPTNRQTKSVRITEHKGCRLLTDVIIRERIHIHGLHNIYKRWGGAHHLSWGFAALIAKPHHSLLPRTTVNAGQGGLLQIVQGCLDCWYRFLIYFQTICWSTNPSLIHGSVFLVTSLFGDSFMPLANRHGLPLLHSFAPRHWDPVADKIDTHPHARGAVRVGETDGKD